ncbi:hypothetical protein DERF_007819 [Dermatophagoides farinae]|uniref:Uncharacterized protein n=1 Tax=Dermatophagoides farinae TaxID=6954 RepID=A0A922L3L1_DERFA|nr:hypothetical protein DERF_007819 [Dermatophagoides farinae]
MEHHHLHRYRHHCYLSPFFDDNYDGDSFQE